MSDPGAGGGPPIAANTSAALRIWMLLSQMLSLAMLGGGLLLTAFGSLTYFLSAGGAPNASPLGILLMILLGSLLLLGIPSLVLWFTMRAMRRAAARGDARRAWLLSFTPILLVLSVPVLLTILSLIGSDGQP